MTQQIQEQEQDKLVQHNAEYRYYTKGNNIYASTTTFINEMEDKSWLQYVNMSADVLENLRNNAAEIGNETHAVLNAKLAKTDPPKKISLLAQAHVRQIEKEIPKITNIKNLEFSLKSDILHLAGTVDVVADYDGVLSIIDFKTTKKPKYGQKRNAWYLQTAAYAIMYRELEKRDIQQTVIINSAEDGKVRTYVQPAEKYTEELLQKLQMFYNPPSVPTEYLKFLRRLE